MANLDKPWKASQAAVDGGCFSRFARGQYRAIAAMRVRLFVNTFRTPAGAFELGARTVSFFIYACMGLSLGIGAGAAAYSLVVHHRWQALATELWIAGVLWLAIAIALVSFQEQFDLSSLLQFPVRFQTFFGLHLIFGLVDVSTIVGGLCSLGILVAITWARPDLFVAAAAGLAAFCAFNILLVRAVLAWIDRWLAKRRSREFVSALFLLSLLCLQLLNPVVRDEGGLPRRHGHEHGPGMLTYNVPSWVKPLKTALAWLPPDLAAAVPAETDHAQFAHAAGSLGILVLYGLAAGAVLGLRLRAEYRGENLGEAPGRKQEEKSALPRLTVGSGPIAAQIEREIRALSRSVPQLFSVGVPMLMVFVIASLFRSGSVISPRPVRLALPVCVAYGLLGFTQLMYNNLGGEGKGIQLLFLFPVPVRTVLLGKNLFHGALYLLVAVASAVLTGIRLGYPGAAVIVTTVGWVAFALPANLAAGNILSLAMAYRANLGRIGRQSGSQANALLSMLIQTMILGVGAAVISLASYVGDAWIAAPILFVLACAAIFGWILVLRSADKIAHVRKDALIAKLARIE
ncbi:MAG: hypothetical protein WCC26_12455 [Terracidiphilus sp.]